MREFLLLFLKSSMQTFLPGCMCSAAKSWDPCLEVSVVRTGLRKGPLNVKSSSLMLSCAARSTALCPRIFLSKGLEPN